MIGRKASLLVGIGLALVTATMASSTAGAASYRIGLLPQSMPAGGQATIRATITASTSRVGSINLTPPEGYAVARVGPPRGARAAIVRRVVRLRSLGIARGRSKVVRLTVNAPCSSRSKASWKATAKPSANFRGRRLSSRGAHTRLTTRTTARCYLSFAPQPADVKVGDRITGTSFDPSGPPPAVVVLDRAGRQSRSDGVRVALTLAPGSAAGPLTGGSMRRSVKGVVTFPQLSVGSPGSYRLVASGKRIPPRTSNSFSAEQDAVVCTADASCSASATQTGTFGPNNTPYSLRLDVTAPDIPGDQDAGALRTSFNTGTPLDCRGYHERSPDTGVFIGPNREKIVRFTISPTLLAASPGRLEACVGLPYKFLTKLFTPAAVHEDTNGDGVGDQFVGQLNGCFEIVLGLLISPPCVAQRGTDAAGNAFITIRVPPSDQDPRYRS
jgi:hypothetical protein